MENGRQGITVVGVEASSFHRLRAALVKFVPGKGLVRITGANGSGKTSFLRSIKAALGGAGEVLGEAVINEGSEDGTGLVRLELSNGYTVVRRFTEANPKGYLTVVGPDGGKHGQGKLDEWAGPLSFDPSAFFGLHPERQREILLALGSDPDLPAKLAELRRQRAEKYSERTPWISQKRRAAQVSQPEGERPEPVDVSAELRRMGELQKIERERQDASRAWDRAKEEWRRLADAAARKEAHVRELEEALVKARDDLATAEHARDRQERVIEECEVAWEGAPDPSDEIDAVRARMEAADQVRAALEPWKAWEQAQAQVEEATQAEKALTAEMDALEEQEGALIAQAGIGIAGLTFAEDGAPQLNGRPLSVASGAERCRLAVAVAMAANAELRICLLDEEANGLDLDGLNELDRLAQEHGFQVWCARIGLEGAGHVEVVDGEAFVREAEPAEV